MLMENLKTVSRLPGAPNPLPEQLHTQTLGLAVLVDFHISCPLTVRPLQLLFRKAWWEGDTVLSSQSHSFSSDRRLVASVSH